MTSTSDTKVTQNGPGTVSGGLTAFEAQATKLPTGPAPDPNVAVAYALGWAVADALTCIKYQVFDHLVKVPELDAPSDQWNLLVNQVISQCGHLNDHLKSTKADFDLSAQLTIAASLSLGSPPGDVKAAIVAKNATATELHTGILRVLWSVSSPLAKSYQLGHEMEQMCATPIAETFATASAEKAAEDSIKPSARVSASVQGHNANIHRLLTALASKLPANAAHANDNSLRLWAASLIAGGQE